VPLFSQLFSGGRRASFFLPAGGAMLLMLATLAAAEEPADADALKLFEARIMPIFKSEKPSSCVQCHLASVDLRNYILPSHTSTFLALRRDGLIDVEEPGKSKILTLIKMGDQDRDPRARRIHERTRQAEFEAFSSWIAACCRDPELLKKKLPANLGKVGPDKPLEIVRHARKSRVVESFARNIWSQRMRCFPCHTPHELDPGNPKHRPLIRKNAGFVKKFGARINIFDKTPESTLSKLILSSRRPVPTRYPLINIAQPAKSLLLLKPTSKLPVKQKDGTFAPPSSFDPVSHMGGLKMHVNDQSYKSFMLWLTDYASVAAGRYVTVEDLPADNWVPTKRVIRLRNIPAEWGERTVVQLFVHNQIDGEWSKEPVAFTQSVITPRRMVVGALSLFRPDTPDNANQDPLAVLKPGKFLIKAYADQKNRLADDPAALLGESEFMGQAVTAARWLSGFPNAETLSATVLKK